MEAETFSTRVEKPPALAVVEFHCAGKDGVVGYNARINAKTADYIKSKWSEKRFADVWGIPLPGEFQLNQNLFGISPGPATFLHEPCLDAEGRLAYKQALKSILEDLPGIETSVADNGRLKRVQRSLIVTLTLLNTIAACQGETKVWHDW